MARLARDLESLYRSHRQQLFTCALAVTRSRELAEDAVHEAFCRLIRLNRRPRDLKVYVFRCVRNAALDQLRSRKPASVDLTAFIFETGDDAHERIATEDLARRAEGALLELPETERETIVQHVYGELTFREIGRLRGVAAGTIASWYYKGIKALESRLRESAWKT